jgi:hypothetical protein
MMLLNDVRGDTLSCRLATLHMVRGMALPYGVTSSASRASEWLVTWRCTVELHCSALSACLAGDDDAACLLILQVPWKHTSLLTCLGQLILSLFLRSMWLTECRGTRDGIGALHSREVGSGAMVHVAAPEPSLAGRRGPEPRDT